MGPSRGIFERKAAALRLPPFAGDESSGIASRRRSHLHPDPQAVNDNRCLTPAANPADRPFDRYLQK